MNKEQEKKFEQGLTDIMDSIIDVANKERASSEPYKDLFDADDIYSVITKATRQMTDIALTTSQVLKDKYGIEVTNDMFNVLQCLSYAEFQMSRWYKDNEGYACSSDKSRYIVAKYFSQALKTSNKDGGKTND